MFRFYEEFVLKAFILLMWVKRSGLVINDGVKQQIQDEMINGNWDSTSGARTIVDNVPIRPLLDESFNFDQIIREMNDAINGHFRNGNSKDADLIDTVVRILKLSRGTSHINGKTLEKLRKAVLNSDELAGLKDRIAKGELTCGTCGKNLVPGEMLTIYVTSEGTNNVVCLGCDTPTYIQCDHSTKCVSKIPIPDKLRENIRKLADRGCPTCHAPKVEGGVEGSEIRVSVDNGAQVGPFTVSFETGSRTITLPASAPPSTDWVDEALNDDDDDDSRWIDDELDLVEERVFSSVRNEAEPGRLFPNAGTSTRGARIVGMSTPQPAPGTTGDPNWRGWISREQIEEMRGRLDNPMPINATPESAMAGTARTVQVNQSLRNMWRDLAESAAIRSIEEPNSFLVEQNREE